MAAKTPDAKIDMLALAVARGLSVRAAARSIGENESTAAKWAARPDFKGRVNRLREEVISEAVGALAGLAKAAVSTLGELMKDTNEPEVRFKAARAILSDLISVREHAEVTRELAEVRKLVEPQAQNRS
jgi:transposase-like protein